MFKYYYRHNVLEKIERLKGYIDFSQRVLLSGFNDEKKENVKFLEDIEDEFYREKFSEQVWDSEYEIEFGFLPMHWSSVFLTQYSYLEHILDRVCAHYAKKTNARIKHKDIKGMGIERAKDYITKYMGVDFPAKDEWERIKRYAVLRNKLVHTGPDIDMSVDIDEKAVKVIEKTPTLSIDRFLVDDGYHVEPKVEINSEFLLDVINDIDIFLQKLFDQLEKIPATEGPETDGVRQ